MKHNYEQFESTFLWKIVEEAIKQLEKNEDLVITTKQELIIGFLCKSIYDDCQVSKKEPK